MLDVNNFNFLLICNLNKKMSNDLFMKDTIFFYCFFWSQKPLLYNFLFYSI